VTIGAFAALLAHPARAGLFTDFDGTLAPIVDNPEDARPVEGAVEALASLAPRLGRIGVISGRPAEFLLRHVGVPGVSLWGQHGIETVEDGRVVPLAAAEQWQAVVGEVADRAAAELGPLVDVERKILAITLHYRRAPAEAPRVRAWAERTVTDTGLVRYSARMSVELRPPTPHGKGRTLEAAAVEADLAAVAFAGDDAGDLDAFDALDRLAAKGVDAVRIGIASEEAPAQLLARADVVLDGPHQMVAALQELALALSRR
jgi:trehalose 6-phosphate phosphatase